MSSDVFHFTDDQIRVLEALNEYCVSHLVIGGYAVRFHGYLRETHDLDLLVECSPQGACLVHQALTSLPDRFEVSKADLARPKKEITLKEFFYNVDLLTSVDGLDFDEAYQERVTTRANSVQLTIISKKHLIQAKKTAGRE